MSKNASKTKNNSSCIEFDFPILPINAISQIEGNAGKPIYQTSKWWARRRSSIFRATLLGGALKSQADLKNPASETWKAFYENHQKKNNFSNLKVADIFMGGGTTIVEALRLGMQVTGNDLNPVAWFITKCETTGADKEKLTKALKKIEEELHSEIAPFYQTECPRGHQGTWTERESGKKIKKTLDPLSLPPLKRSKYTYRGPENIYTFWAKHGVCRDPKCGHRTPIMSSSVITTKTLSIDFWEKVRCHSCKKMFNLEKSDNRIAPAEKFFVSPSETVFTVLSKNKYDCPHCKHSHNFSSSLGKAKKKKILLTLLIHPDWLAGSPSAVNNLHLGGSATTSAKSNSDWYNERLKNLRIIEVRGNLPKKITLAQEDGKIMEVDTSFNTVPKRSNFHCGKCGTVQDGLKSTIHFGKTAPIAPYLVHGYCPECDENGENYNGRFFSSQIGEGISAAEREWEKRREKDLRQYWPRSEIPDGKETLQHSLKRRGNTHWWTMFNSRQLLILSSLLRKIDEASDQNVKEFILSGFQNYLRNQNLFCFWNIQRDTLEPHFSGNNYHPKWTVVENSVFPKIGRGNWTSCSESLFRAIDWFNDPWDIQVKLGKNGKKSERFLVGDSIKNKPKLFCSSSTNLKGKIETGSIDMVVTDPPFGNNINYAELSDFFYVWLRLVLRKEYPEYFSHQFSLKKEEAVTNHFRNPENPDLEYTKLLTQCWKEANRILKPNGILAFTFHHSQDEPWIQLLESLFKGGFELISTYPIRSDEKKGNNDFGSRLIEYDVLHVCRKHSSSKHSIAWEDLLPTILKEVEETKRILANQAGEIPQEDLKVIQRGKALQFISKFYGKIENRDGRPWSISQGILDIHNLSKVNGTKYYGLPSDMDLISQCFIKAFAGKMSISSASLAKQLNGTGFAPEDFVGKNWCFRKGDRYFTNNSPRRISENNILAWDRYLLSKNKKKIFDKDETVLAISKWLQNIRESKTREDHKVKSTSTKT